MAITLSSANYAFALTTDFDYNGTTTVLTATGDIPLVCGITSEVGAEDEIEIDLLEQGSTDATNKYRLIVKSNSSEKPTYAVSYNSTTLKLAGTDTLASAGTDVYFTLDGTNVLGVSNPEMVKSGDTYTADIYAVTAESFASYQKMTGAKLVGTITVTCPGS